MSKNLNSFQCASSFPSKIVSNPDLIEAIKKHEIYPIHVQLNPTNYCPLNCSFCSCSKRDKSSYVPFDKMIELVKTLKRMKCKAVTISGGGEPLAYPHINELIDLLDENEIRIGLVTNAVLANNLKEEQLRKITWCRISLSTVGIFHKEKYDFISRCPEVDMAFSLVLYDFDINRDLDKVKEAINYTNEHNYTHIRIVNDIINVENNDDFVTQVKDALQGQIDDSRVIYQSRGKYTSGAKRCLWSLLRPVLDATGSILPCCGVQYATNPPSFNFTEEFKMSTFDTFEQDWKDQKFFDGSVCSKCYYSSQNDLLNTIWDSNDLTHYDFV